MLEGKHPSREDLVTICYRCNLKVTLLFVMSKNAESTRKGVPYEIKFADMRGNVHVRLVNRLLVMSDFFQDSNVVDKHNQARQHKLGLEKKWKIRNPYLRLTATMISFTAADL